MKKTIAIIVLILSAAINLNAQDISNHAIGVRFGDSDGFGGEISYQYALSDANRLEFDLGFRNHKYYDAFKLSGLYQWVWNIDGGFNWYAGVGAGVGSWSISDGYTGVGNEGVFLNLDGDVGIEYNFDFPLLVSLDIRPEFGIIGEYGDNADFDIALGVRYQF
jgi:hypothetical protein